MKMYRMIVWHLNRDIAILRGLGSNEVHMMPLVGATCMHSEKDKAAARQLWEAQCYVPVAIVLHASDTPEQALEAAYTLTNHIDQPWCRESGPANVRAFTWTDNRSTSVGDVIEISDASGPIYGKAVCMSFGFEPLHTPYGEKQ